jgi:hypothetical protein
MSGKIVISLVLTFFLSSCGADSANQERLAAIATACENVKADGTVWDLFGTEKKFAALAKLDIKYLGLLEIYTKWSQEMTTIGLTETGGPKKYPPFPRSITQFCNE